MWTILGPRHERLRFSKQAERGGIACAAFDDRMPLNRATPILFRVVLPKARMIDNIHAAADARTDMFLSRGVSASTPNNSYTSCWIGLRLRRSRSDCVWIALPTRRDFARRPT